MIQAESVMYVARVKAARGLRRKWAAVALGWKVFSGQM